MGTRRRGRLSLREKLEQSHVGQSYYAAMAGKPQPPKPALLLKPKRQYTKPGSDGRVLESAINDAIYQAAKVAPHVKLYRNNRGVAVYGNKQVAYGVGPRGGSDWIGYKRVFITSDMIGSFVAVFVAIEAKRPGEKADDNQQRFIDEVLSAGGCAGVATSGEQALELLS